MRSEEPAPGRMFSGVTPRTVAMVAMSPAQSVGGEVRSSQGRCSCRVSVTRGDGAGLRGEPDRLQADALVEVHDLAPTDADDVRAAMRLNPAVRGIHEQRGQFASAMRLQDSEEPDLMEFVVECEGEAGAGEIL